MKALSFAPVLVFFLIVAATLQSLPRLAAEQSLSCKTCHINPNGGGARTEFGNHSVAFHELTLPQTKKYFEKKKHSPRISESVLAGFDYRYLVLEGGRVFRMQTDAYLTFEPYKDLMYHLRFWENGVNENYMLLYLDHQKYYLKIGRFYPAYGLRMADHKTYVRERIGFGSNVYLDGLSLGAEIGGSNIAVEFFKEDFFKPFRRFVGAVHIFRTGYTRSISYLAGFSARISEELNGSNGAFPHTKGIFGGLSYNRFTLLGELDLAGRANDSLLAYAGLTTRIEYGLYLIAEYNFIDNDRDFQSGVEEFLRFSLEFYPIPFVQLRPSYTYYANGPLVGEDNFFLQFHVGY